MKKNSWLILATMLVAFALSACNDLSSPESALGSAYKAVQKNDLGDFRDTLTGAALQAWGNKAGLAKLRAELNGLDVRFGQKNYLWGKRDSYWHETWAVSLDVLGKTKTETNYSRIKTATVICDWHRGHVHHLPPSRAPFPDTGDMDTPDSTMCQIAELN